MTRKLNESQLNILIDELKNKEVVSFPTDTVYGIACICDEEAISKMKWVKGRDEKKPFPMMVSNKKQIDEIAEVNETASKVIECFMPGALTIVLKKKEIIPDSVTNGQHTIAIRMPDDETVLKILEEAGPLLVTSANLSGQMAGHTSEEVLMQLDGRISCILEGISGRSEASTIVDCSGNDVKILREGPITLEMLKNHCVE